MLLSHLALNSALQSNFLNSNQARFKEEVGTRIAGLERQYRTFQSAYDNWIKNLREYREHCSWLKLFTNREIMILIILLRKMNSEDSVRVRLLKKLFNFKVSENQEKEENKLTIRCLQHYLSSVRLTEANLTAENLSELCQKHEIRMFADTKLCLEKLSKLLQDLFGDNTQQFSVERRQEKKQQWIVKVERQSSHFANSFGHDLSLTTCCTLLSVFKDRLPSSYQILWCTNTTTEDIHLFFSRIRAFTALNFVVMDIDKAEYRLRESILYQQDLLTREQSSHGNVYYFSNELTTARKGLKEWTIDPSMTSSDTILKTLSSQFVNQGLAQSQFQIIYGESGMGK